MQIRQPSLLQAQCKFEGFIDLCHDIRRQRGQRANQAVLMNRLNLIQIGDALLRDALLWTQSDFDRYITNRGGQWGDRDRGSPCVS